MFETEPKQIAKQLKRFIASSEVSNDAQADLAELLDLASGIVEGSAFELARMDGPGEVTELILIAARLERMAVMLRETSETAVIAGR